MKQAFTDFDPLTVPLFKAKWITGRNHAEPDFCRLTFTPKGKTAFAELGAYDQKRGITRESSALQQVRFYCGVALICGKHGLVLRVDGLRLLSILVRAEARTGLVGMPAPND